MIVFLRNIPNNTLRSEIVRFIDPVIKGGLFTAGGEINFVRIVAMKDKVTKLAEHHALVEIEPENVAIRVIKKLNGARFKTKKIVVREFHIRKRSNLHYASKNNLRRDLEIEELETPRVIGDRKFHRLYHSSF